MLIVSVVGWAGWAGQQRGFPALAESVAGTAATGRAMTIWSLLVHGHKVILPRADRLA